MKLLGFLFDMGIVFIILSLIWGFFMLILNLLTAGERKGIFEENLLKSANYYLLANLSAMVVLGRVASTGVTHYGFQIAGLVMLYLYLVSKQEKQQFKIRMQRGLSNFSFNSERRNKTLDTIYLLVTLALYAACVMIPEMVDNGINRWFMGAIVDIKDTPIIGWIIKFIGVFFLLNIFVRGIIQTQKLTQPKAQNDDPFDQNQSIGNQPNKEDDDDFDDYEIVE